MQELEWIDIGKNARGKRRLTKKERLERKRRRHRLRMIRGMILAAIVMLMMGLGFGAVRLAGGIYDAVMNRDAVPAVAGLEPEPAEPWDARQWKEFYMAPLEVPELSVQLLSVNEFSRPGEALPEVKNIFVHYTANPGTTAEQNRSYFESLSQTQERSASAHFVIGYDGVIVQCIPTKEIAYAVQTRNYDSISIECCYVDESGVFTSETYDSLIELTAWLLHKYELEPQDVLRHYDSNGKLCPKYYVEHEDAWQQFLTDLTQYMEEIASGGSFKNH